MARRPRSRTARAFPKTLTGILASIALAVLAALGVKTDGFHRKPSAPPTERPTAARTAPPPGDLPRTPSTFTAAKRALYDQVYADHRVTFYCGCAYERGPANRPGELRPGSPGRQAQGATDRSGAHLPRRPVRPFPPLLAQPRRLPRVRQERRANPLRPGLLPGGGPGVRGRPQRPVQPGARRGRSQRPAQGLQLGHDPRRETGVRGLQLRGGFAGIRRVEPPETVQGDIARVMFYMSATYGFNLSAQDQQLSPLGRDRTRPTPGKSNATGASRPFRARATASWRTTPRCSARLRRWRRLPRQRFPRRPHPRRSQQPRPAGPAASRPPAGRWPVARKPGST